MAPNAFGPEPPRGTFVSGGTMEVTVKTTVQHWGWFEFRLAVPEDGGADRTVAITQALLNEHVCPAVLATRPTHSAH